MIDLRAEPSYLDMLEITRQLRVRDKEELDALVFDRSPEAHARLAVASGAFRWGAYLDHQPVAAIGAHPLWPNVWQAWAYGTDDWPKVALTLTKHVRRFMIPAIYRTGAHQVQALALSDHTAAARWLVSLGAIPAQKLDNYGRNQENFTRYVWTRQSVRTL
ncbi:MAG: hypothetical protein AAGK37_19200 [Pseudomonadota bacterium]